MHLIATGDAEAEIASQRRGQRTGAARRAVKFVLAGDELAYAFQFNRRYDDRALAKLIEQQPAHRMEGHAAGLRRESADMVHIVVEAAQLFVYRCDRENMLSDDGVGAKHDKQMPERRTEVVARSSYRICTVAARQVV